MSNRSGARDTSSQDSGDVPNQQPVRRSARLRAKAENAASSQSDSLSSARPTRARPVVSSSVVLDRLPSRPAPQSSRQRQTPTNVTSNQATSSTRRQAPTNVRSNQAASQTASRPAAQPSSRTILQTSRRSGTGNTTSSQANTSVGSTSSNTSSVVETTASGSVVNTSVSSNSRVRNRGTRSPGEVPIRRRRLNQTPDANPAVRAVAPPPVNENEVIAASLGLTLQEYEQALIAQHMFNAQQQQIQQQIEQDNIMANRIANNADEDEDAIPPLHELMPARMLAQTRPRVERPPITQAPVFVPASTFVPPESLKDRFAASPSNGGTPDPCTICFEDVPVNPFTCNSCHQVVGCFVCVKRWFDNPRENGEERNCPLCRQKWTKKLFNKPKSGNAAPRRGVRT